MWCGFTSDGHGYVHVCGHFCNRVNKCSEAENKLRTALLRRSERGKELGLRRRTGTEQDLANACFLHKPEVMFWDAMWLFLVLATKGRCFATLYHHTYQNPRFLPHIYHAR